MNPSKSETTWETEVAEKYFKPFNRRYDEKFIDLLVEPNAEGLFAPFLWAEAKKKITTATLMFAQLLLTIKPTYDKGEKDVPKYLGVFDNEKICFVEFYHLWDIINANGFNWKDKPSNVSKSNENIVAKYLTQDIVNEFTFGKDDAELKKFIKDNFTFTEGTTKLQITKNNFLHVYNRWEKEVRTTLIVNADMLTENDLVDGDFFLGDLLSRDNVSFHDALRVRLRGTYFDIVDRQDGFLFKKEIGFNDGQKSHTKFWNRYCRPPAEKYWNEMMQRRELLVPQLVREQKGAYFTPQIWVQKSQEYLEKAFGENWQDEYYVWDCCAGTGNLLAGLTNPDKVWASTLDKPDVDVMHELINSGNNLLHPHVFQFDFLNDEFKPVSEKGKIPDQLYKILISPEKQRQLIIYINPPYSEARGKMTGKNSKAGYHQSKTHDTLLSKIGNAVIEKFSQFSGRVRLDLPSAKLAMFSTMKYVNSPNFNKFRNFFNAEYKCGFIVLANTFDNVNGQFPIGFLIWDLAGTKKHRIITTDILTLDGRVQEQKRFYKYTSKTQLINDWVKTFSATEDSIATIIGPAADFQHQQNVWVIAPNTDSNWFHWQIGEENLIETAIYFAVRHCIPHTWVNHNDQMLFPNNKYNRSRKFQNNCLTFLLFNEKNKIKSAECVNHWIPFKRAEVKAYNSFASTFMYDFIQQRGSFSKEAGAVFAAGKTLWTYYHETIRTDTSEQPNDASLYDIRAYFKGKTNGRVNAKSKDEVFTKLDTALKDAMKKLADEIKPCVYEYGFLISDDTV